MKEELEESFEAKACPICSELLPLSEFGICRARKDGRNLYCKVCIRRKVTDSRRALREYKSRKRDAQILQPLRPVAIVIHPPLFSTPRNL